MRSFPSLYLLYSILSWSGLVGCVFAKLLIQQMQWKKRISGFSRKILPSQGARCRQGALALHWGMLVVWDVHWVVHPRAHWVLLSLAVDVHVRLSPSVVDVFIDFPELLHCMPRTLFWRLP